METFEGLSIIIGGFIWLAWLSSVIERCMYKPDEIKGPADERAVGQNTMAIAIILTAILWFAVISPSIDFIFGTPEERFARYVSHLCDGPRAQGIDCNYFDGAR